MMNASSPLAGRLVLARHLRSMPAAALAIAAGISAPRLSHYESGDRAPDLDVVVRLADALEVSVDFLVGRTDDVESAGETTNDIIRRLGQLPAGDLATVGELIDIMIARAKRRKRRQPDMRWGGAEAIYRERIAEAKR